MPDPDETFEMRQRRENAVDKWWGWFFAAVGVVVGLALVVGCLAGFEAVIR